MDLANQSRETSFSLIYDALEKRATTGRELQAGAIASQTPRGLISRTVVKHEVDRFVAYAGVSYGERKEAAVLRSVRLQLLLDRWQPPACLLFSTRAILYAAASSTKNRSMEITSARSLARSRRCIERPRGELLLPVP